MNDGKGSKEHRIGNGDHCLVRIRGGRDKKVKEMNTKTFKKRFTKKASQQTLGKFDQNATQTRAKKYALPLVVVTAVLLAFCSPAVADYSGDRPLTIYDHDTINGGLVFETITDGSGYTNLAAMPELPWVPLPSLTQEITITIPEGATVKMARLYNTYCWSKSDDGDADVPGAPAEADMTFDNGTTTQTKTCKHGYVNWTEAPNPIYFGIDVVHYWDTKNLTKYGGVYDYPSGEFAWDVTDMVTGSGTYTATITNNDSTPTLNEYFSTFGFGLLVVYEHPDSPEIEYWIAEGCDALMARNFETPENATTSATFGGVNKVGIANLTTVLTCSQGGLLDPPENMIYFNGVEIGPSTAEGDMHYGVNYFDVTSLLRPDENVVEFQDRDDCEYVHNAFLVVEYEEAGICGDVDDDGYITVFDAKQVWRVAGEVIPPSALANEWAADVDCDGYITVYDAKQIWRVAGEVIPESELLCCT